MSPQSPDKLLLLRSHQCSRDLSDEALREICDAAELVELGPGDTLHQANQRLTAVYLIVHGRLKQSVVDINDAILFQRFLKRGSQFGALAASHAEPVPVEVVAVESSTVLKLDFDSTIQFTRKFPAFGLNLTQTISSMVRGVLMSDRAPKHASLVAILHETSATRSLTQRLVQRLADIGETVCVMSDRSDLKPVDGVSIHSLVEDGQWMTRDEMRRRINEWSGHRRIILDVDARMKPETASLLVEFSDQVLWCPDPQNAAASVQGLSAIQSQSTGWRDKVSLVWVVPSEHWVVPQSSPQGEGFDREFKLTFSGTQPNQGSALHDGLERLVRHLRGIRIGIALGGGGARGMAHLGVLKSLQQSGIGVDMIAGTSAGAMTGILHAAGFDPDYIVGRFVEDLKPGWPFRMMPSGKNWYLLYKYRRGHFERMLRKYLADWRLEQLPIPVHSVTVDLVAGQPVFRSRGDAVNAILESINLPVFSRPICRDGQALVDGGLVDNIPADLLVRRGCNFVIAVSVTSAIESEFAKNRSTTPTDRMRSGSILQTVLRSYLVQHVNMNSVGIQPADIVIEPGVAGVELSDFSRTQDLAEVGERAGNDRMKQLKSLLSKIDPQMYVSD